MYHPFCVNLSPTNIYYTTLLPSGIHSSSLPQLGSRRGLRIRYWLRVGKHVLLRRIEREV